MAKRRATTELNRDNWDVEEEKEDPGTFKKLNETELKYRTIRKAKRSLGNNALTGNKETAGVSPFAAFSGFSTSSSSPNPFSFLKKTTEASKDSPFKVPPNKDEKKENGDSVATGENKTSEAEVTNTKQVTDSSSTDKQKPIRSIEYYRQLQSLNESVMKWMELHIAKNSCCDFTPVFNDYKKHLDTLNFTYPVKSKEGSEAKWESFKRPAPVKEDSVSKKSNNSVNHGFSFGNSVKTDDETDYGANFKSNTTNTSTFSFGMKRTPSATSSSSSGPTTSFEEEIVQEKKPFEFSFGLKNAQKNSEDSNAKPFSFASSPIDKSAEKEPAADDPEYVPPKNDFVAVKEEDAFYSKRCKLFYKKDESYVDRGIGILHLKPLDGKTQLVIRADTNLGNILLNIVLSESLPMSRTGKNNVLLVCIPNPPLINEKKKDGNGGEKTDAKEAIPMLIRVKTSEDADELLETLNKHKS